MVQKLTQNSISLFEPLFSKPFRFSIFANRTVSLWFFDSVNFIKGVTNLTGIFSLIYSPYRQGVFKSIFSLGNKFKVFWVNTFSISTNMVNNKIVLYLVSKYIVRDTMRFASFLSKIEKPVSVFIQVSLPKMAFSNQFPRLIKSIKFIFCVVFHRVHYTPYKLYV